MRTPGPSRWASLWQRMASFLVKFAGWLDKKSSRADSSWQVYTGEGHGIAAGTSHLDQVDVYALLTTDEAKLAFDVTQTRPVDSTSTGAVMQAPIDALAFEDAEYKTRLRDLERRRTA